jgi:hypothetical protein
MNEKRDAYVQKLKAQLDEWNTDINKLEAKVDQAEVGAKIEYHKRIADLRARIKEVENIITDKKTPKDIPKRVLQDRSSFPGHYSTSTYSMLTDSR